MLAQRGKLVGFEEAKRTRTADIYLPGDIDPRIEPHPLSEEYYRRGRNRVRYMGRPLQGEVTATGEKLKRGVVIPFHGAQMRRFTGGTSLRQQGKARIMGRLQMIPSGHIPGRGVIPIRMRDVPQQPQYFPELAGFGETPTGTVNPKGTVPVVTGWWGNLTNILTQAGTVILGTQTAKAKAQIATSQARISEAQAATQQASISGMVWRYLPIILAVGGGTLILYMVIQRRKKRG